jgi:diaminopimelate epimerase
MSIPFYKFHGAGNDFIMVDNRQGLFNQAGLNNRQSIQHLCHRHFGIGADGLMLLENAADHDFSMIYFNSDGLEGSMCGNGGRCMVAFARHLGIIEKDTRFGAVDGMHHARILEESPDKWTIALEIQDTPAPQYHENRYLINTGSPHLVIFHENIGSIDVVTRGRELRNAPDYTPKGINVNFVQVASQNQLMVRTYERGVENETLACGTGAVAAAIVAWAHGIQNAENRYLLQAPGGQLKVAFTPPEKPEGKFTGISLTGPAQMVFSGKFEM